MPAKGWDNEDDRNLTEEIKKILDEGCNLQSVINLTEEVYTPEDFVDALDELRIDYSEDPEYQKFQELLSGFAPSGGYKQSITIAFKMVSAVISAAGSEWRLVWSVCAMPSLGSMEFAGNRSRQIWITHSMQYMNTPTMFQSKRCGRQELFRYLYLPKSANLVNPVLQRMLGFMICATTKSFHYGLMRSMILQPRSKKIHRLYEMPGQGILSMTIRNFVQRPRCVPTIRGEKIRTILWLEQAWT